LFTAVADSAPVRRQTPSRTASWREERLPVSRSSSVEIAGRGVVGGAGGFLGQRGAPEVGVQDDAGGVDDAAEAGPLLPGQALRRPPGDRLRVGGAVDRLSLPQPSPQRLQFGADGGDGLSGSGLLSGGVGGEGGEHLVDRRQLPEGVVGHGRPSYPPWAVR
jgi:hypothetical protein